MDKRRQKKSNTRNLGIIQSNEIELDEKCYKILSELETASNDSAVQLLELLRIAEVDPESFMEFMKESGYMNNKLAKKILKLSQNTNSNLFSNKHDDKRKCTGKVKWFNDQKGYGFISSTDGNDYFVHHSGIVGTGFRTLTEGAKVEFEIEKEDEEPRAVKVTII